MSRVTRQYRVEFTLEVTGPDRAKSRDVLTDNGIGEYAPTMHEYTLGAIENGVTEYAGNLVGGITLTEVTSR